VGHPVQEVLQRRSEEAGDLSEAFIPELRRKRLCPGALFAR
jgi:hypothetical protein